MRDLVIIGGGPAGMSAAIAAYEASNGNEVAPGGFRVVSFRRTNGGKAWNSK